MKFTIKNNFFKEKIGKIYFSREVVIYETVNQKEEIFQTIDFEEENTIKRLKLYIKKLKSLCLDIVIDKLYFQKMEIIVEEDEITDENIENYIEYSSKEFLKTADISGYFIKYFKENDKKYTVFIFERDFIEEIIEFALENKLNINKIIIKDEKEYILNDYDVLLKGRKKSFADKKIAVLIFIFIIIFFSLKIYNLKIQKEINNLNEQILSEEENLNKIKIEYDILEKEITALKDKLEESSIEKEYFSDKILKIFENMPENITAENIYFEKGILNIKGISADEKSFFDFLEFLEKNKKIENAKYDYIVKRENFYEFFLELKVY